MGKYNYNQGKPNRPRKQYNMGGRVTSCPDGYHMMPDGTCMIGESHGSSGGSYRRGGRVSNRGRRYQAGGHVHDIIQPAQPGSPVQHVHGLMSSHGGNHRHDMMYDNDGNIYSTSGPIGAGSWNTPQTGRIVNSHVSSQSPNWNVGGYGGYGTQPTDGGTHGHGSGTINPNPRGGRRTPGINPYGGGIMGEQNSDMFTNCMNGCPRFQGRRDCLMNCDTKYGDPRNPAF